MANVPVRFSRYRDDRRLDQFKFSVRASVKRESRGLGRFVRLIGDIAISDVLAFLVDSVMVTRRLWTSPASLEITHKLRRQLRDHSKQKYQSKVTTKKSHVCPSKLSRRKIRETQARHWRDPPTFSA